MAMPLSRINSSPPRAGAAAAILTAERVALNFLQRMSGIASLTAQFVAATAHTSARILDTRKTAPGLRVLDKYAVVCGAGFNHRFGLGDGILIKDNHIQAAGGITQALTMVREFRPHGLKIEVEVDRLDQIEEALAAGAEVILLDNMTVPELSRAVELISGPVPVEHRVASLWPRPAPSPRPASISYRSEP